MEEEEEEVNNEFNTEEIDLILNKKKEYKKEENGIKKIFKFINKKEEIDSEKPLKYISEIDSNSVKYIGYLTENLFKEYFGYYKYENKDEYIGEWKDDLKENKGMYFYFNEENNLEEFYLGEWKNNFRNGKGIYIWKNSNEKIPFDKSNFDVVIGDFENNDFKYGLTISKKDNTFNIYKGKYENNKKNDNKAFFLENYNKAFYGNFINDEIISGRFITYNEKHENNKKHDNKGFFLENYNKVFYGNFINDDIIFGRFITYNEKYEIINSFYFEKNNNNDYNFEKEKEKENDIIIKKEVEDILKYDFPKNLAPMYQFMKNFFSQSSDISTFEKMKKKEFFTEIPNFLNITKI